jgi:3-deoxy-D-manno-octulosonic acid (KDO) 8-phosphate synthase
MFVRHPCEFVFQFVVNLTVMFTLIVKEVISDKRLMAAMLLNNFFVIYVAMHSVKLTGAGAEEEGSSTNDVRAIAYDLMLTVGFDGL